MLFGLPAFAKASIIYEEPHGNETDSDNEEKEPGVFDGEPIKK